MCDTNKNGILATTETALRCAILGAWLPCFVSQFMLRKRGGLDGKTAYINAVIMLSSSLFLFVNTQRGTFLINLSCRLNDSHLCCQRITSNFSNIYNSCENINPHMWHYSLPGTVAPYWRLQGSIGSPASVAIFSDPSPFVCQQIWLLVAMNSPRKTNSVSKIASHFTQNPNYAKCLSPHTLCIGNSKNVHIKLCFFS